jgi:rhodanese-related sulfurtransferase
MIENVPPKRVWEALRSNPKAQLVDVRTEAEWNFVGLPDLSFAGKQVVPIEWQVYPSMAPNTAFVEQLKQVGFTQEHHIYFICRSGQRSYAAALAARDAGFRHTYNVAEGFEGGLDAAGHRGVSEGWKAAGLPWRQR